MRAARVLNAIVLSASVVLGAARADAFCRSTTCTGDCPRDADGCKTTGAPLGWASLCAGMSIQRDGTQNLSLEDQVRPAIERSFAAWSELGCGDGAASMAFAVLEDVSCHATEYNSGGPNANVILFQDNKWQYHSADDTLAKTTVTFDSDTGAILDADIEVNHAYNEFTVGDENVVYDLQSVITHELGHALGLDHSPDFDATMNAAYDPGSIEQRTLEADDVAGICAVYPPGRAGKCDPTPRGGLGDACEKASEDSGGGCAVVRRGAESYDFFAMVGFWAWVSGLVLAARRRSGGNMNKMRS